MNRTVVKALTRLSMVCAFGLFVGAISVSAQSGLSASAGYPSASNAIKQSISNSRKTLMTPAEASTAMAAAIQNSVTKFETAQGAAKVQAKAEVRLYTNIRELVDNGSQSSNALIEGYNKLLPELAGNGDVDAQKLLNDAIVVLSK